MAAFQGVLAKVCTCCPLCIARRKYPGSGYARFMGVVERYCPFCRAYDRREESKNSAATESN